MPSDRQSRKRARSAPTTTRISTASQLPALSSLPAWAETLTFVRAQWARQLHASTKSSENAETKTRTSKQRSKKPQRASPTSRPTADAVWTAQEASRVVEADAEHLTGDEVAYDRYDLAGTTCVNELVLRHVALPTKPPSSSPVSYFQRASEPSPRAAKPSSASPLASPAVFALHRYTYHLVKSLVHPLHNFLQLHHGLHNADEIQIMLMPKSGVVAEADAHYHNKRAHAHAGKSTALATTFRHCYVATNQETLSTTALSAAVKDWGVPGVFQISGFSLIQGRPGRHAELKLLDFLRDTILADTLVAGLTNEEKALVVGERLPCAVCRLIAIRDEPHARLLPSHGHWYTTAAATELLESVAHLAADELDSAAVPPTLISRTNSASQTFLSPFTAAKLLTDHRCARSLH